MRKGFAIFLALFLLPLIPSRSSADGRMSTYLEGKIVSKSTGEWVVATEEGIYWITMDRPASWKRSLPKGRVSFWIAVDQIRRFRPPGEPQRAPEFHRKPAAQPDDETTVAYLLKEPGVQGRADPR